MPEDSKYVMLQAQVDYWKDMIAENGHCVASRELKSMQRLLDQAERNLADYLTPRLLLLSA